MLCNSVLIFKGGLLTLQISNIQGYRFRIFKRSYRKKSISSNLQDIIFTTYGQNVSFVIRLNGRTSSMLGQVRDKRRKGQICGWVVCSWSYILPRKTRSLLYYVLPDVYQLIVRCEHIYRQVIRLFFQPSLLLPWKENADRKSF